MVDGVRLNDGFPAATAQAWRDLVARTLGADALEARLSARTYDGLRLKPLYTREDAADPSPGLRRRQWFDQTRPWDIRARIDACEPAEANGEALSELQGGASSLLLVVADEASAEPWGVRVRSEQDLERALSGVLFDLAPVALETGWSGPEVAEWLSRTAGAQTFRPRLHFHLDPLSLLAERGGAPRPMESVLAEAAAASRFDPASTFLATGRPVHEAGGGEAQEIGFMASAGLAYVKSLGERGLSRRAALEQVALGASLDGEYFLGIAKLRAVRLVWRRLAETLCEDPPPPRIEARSSRRMLSSLDPWVNMLRLACAAFAGAAGGAEIISLDPFTQPLGRAAPFARRHARNLQLILMEEAGLGQVDDPAGGAFFLETLTRDLAQAAWREFQALEAHGGASAAVRSGGLAEAVSAPREARAADVARRRRGLVGVSEFAEIGGAAVEVSAPTPEPPGRGEAAAGFAERCRALAPWRAAAPFEALRRRAQACCPRPEAYLALLGSSREAGARAGYILNLLLAGGILTRSGPPDQAGDARLVVLCGSDAEYVTGAAAATAQARARGAAVYAAGRPQSHEDLLVGAGLQGRLAAGGDAVRDLSALLDLFEPQRDRA